MNETVRKFGLPTGLIILLAVMAVILLTMPQDKTLGSSSMVVEKHPAQADTNGQTTSSQMNNAGQEKTQNVNVNIRDIYNRQVNPEDVIIIGKIANTPSLLEQPPHLVRNDLLDIQTRFIASTQTISVFVNKIPDPSEKLTYLRVKLYDENGPVIFNTEQGPRDYLQDMRLSMGSGNRAGEVTLGIHEEQLVRPLKGSTELYLVAYFMEPAPASGSAKSIKV